MFHGSNVSCILDDKTSSQDNIWENNPRIRRQRGKNQAQENLEWKNSRKLWGTREWERIRVKPISEQTNM